MYYLHTAYLLLLATRSDPLLPAFVAELELETYAGVGDAPTHRFGGRKKQIVTEGLPRLSRSLAPTSALHLRLRRPPPPHANKSAASPPPPSPTAAHRRRRGRVLPELHRRGCGCGAPARPYRTRRSLLLPLPPQLPPAAGELLPCPDLARPPLPPGP
jgi:hypothetical protein